jgi:hypothetical protein
MAERMTERRDIPRPKTLPKKAVVPDLRMKLYHFRVQQLLFKQLIQLLIYDDKEHLMIVC